MKWKLCMFLGLFLLGLLSTAANSVPPPNFVDPYEVYQHRYQWASHGIANYRFELHRVCLMCLERQAVIRVNNGEAILEQIEPDIPDVRGSIDVTEYTVEKLFEFILNAINRNPHSLDVRYDPRYGFPSEIHIDRREHVFDDTISIYINKFKT